MDSAIVIGIIISLVCSFFFSGIEIAFLSVNKLQIQIQGSDGSLSNRVLGYFSGKPSWFIGTTLIGNTLALVFFGNLMARVFVPLLTEYLPPYTNNEAFILVVQTLLSTIIILFTAEFLPKSLFLINPYQMLKMFSIPFALAFIIMFPLMIFIVSLSKVIIIYVLRLEYSEQQPVFGLTDLNIYLKDMHSVSHQDENVALDTTIFNNALEFKTVRVRECMIPRTEITAINADNTIDKLRDTFVESGHSKIIIYKETIDDVIGYCHSSALFKRPEKIEDILTSIIVVPETTLASELMIRFINQQKSLALVVDEFGGTSGIVSMEDVIEEIFGEIEDEHDEDNLTEQKINDHTFLLSARLEIDYLNDTHSWNLPTGDYDTLNGLILSYTEDFPKPGAVISMAPFIFTIQTTQEHRIDTIKVVIEPENNNGVTSE